MRHTLLTLILLATVSQAVAQESKAPDQKPTPAATTETEKPKNEVDRMLEDAANRGESIILGTCITEDCVNESSAITEGLESGRILQMPKPPYPALARMAHASGTVEVRLIIGEEGNVIAAAAISGHLLLFGVSVAAARDAVFSPTKLNGKPVKVVGVIKYNFVAQ